MTLWVLQNRHRDVVATDLALILQTTTGFDIGADGRVTLSFSPGGPASLIGRLVMAPIPIAIRGEDADFSVDVTVGSRLRDTGGSTVFDMFPGTTVIEVAYDVTQCGGKGLWVEGADNAHASFPRYVNLYHELWHADDIVAGRINFLDPESSPIAAENLLRKRDKLDERTGHGGGCGPNQSTFPPPTKGGCFVATAAFGSTLDPNVVSLRRFRDDVLRRTRTGEEFWNEFFPRYARISEPVIQAMNADPELRDLVRTAIVTPLVHYLEVVRTFPDADPAAAGPEWSGFLEQLRGMLDQFADALPRPQSFEGCTTEEAVAEIAVFARYSFRTAEARREWLDDLQADGALPLDVAPGDRARLAARLEADGRDDDEITAILGRPPLEEREPPAAGNVRVGPWPALHGFGDNHVIQRAQFKADEWVYTVNVRNLSTDTFDQIALFLKRIGQDGIVFFANDGVQPGDIAQFFLGLCRDVESYVIGFFIGDQLVAQHPPSGNLTPQLASVLNPMDVDPCADSWSIQ